jgi:hypothetical protein
MKLPCYATLLALASVLATGVPQKALADSQVEISYEEPSSAELLPIYEPGQIRFREDDPAVRGSRADGEGAGQAMVCAGRVAGEVKLSQQSALFPLQR